MFTELIVSLRIAKFIYSSNAKGETEWPVSHLWFGLCGLYLYKRCLSTGCCAVVPVPLHSESSLKSYLCSRYRQTHDNQNLPTQWLQPDSSWTAAQSPSTSQCVNTVVYNPFNNLSPEPAQRRYATALWERANLISHIKEFFRSLPDSTAFHCWLWQHDYRFHLPVHSWLLVQDRPAVFK